MQNKKYLVIVFLCAVLILTYNLIHTHLIDERFESDSEDGSEENEKKFESERFQYFFEMLRDPATNQIPSDIRRIELNFAKRIPKAEKFLNKSSTSQSISWKEAGPNDVGGRTRAIGIDVTNSNVVLSGGVTGGIWKSTDNGSSWKLKTPAADVQSVTAIAQDPRTGFTNNWYYSSGEYLGSGSDQGNTAPFIGGGFYKSTDDGKSWTNITPATFPANHQRSVVAFSPATPNIVYVLTNTEQTDPKTGIEDIRLHRIDISSGASADLTKNLPSFSIINGLFNSYGGWNMAIAVHPTNPNLITIAGTNLYRSFDGFTTPANNIQTNWIGGYNPTTYMYKNLHPDVHTIVFDINNPGSIWVSHDGGLSYASDITIADFPKDSFPWQNKNNSYNVTQFYSVSIPPNAGDLRIMGGTQDNGTPFFTFDGTTTSPSQDITNGDGAYSYFGNSFAYGETQGGFIVRLNYNSNGVPLFNSSVKIRPYGSTGQLLVNPFKVDPSNEQYMYYLGGNLLWRNNQLNAATQTVGWNSVNLNLPQGYHFTTLAVTQNNPASVLYLGASDKSGYPKIFKMVNCTTATTAQDISPSTSLVSSGAYVHCIAVNPDNGNEILIVHSNYNVPTLFYSSDGGQTFSSVSGNLRGSQNSGPSIRSATILPTTQGTIYLVGTSTRHLFNYTIKRKQHTVEIRSIGYSWKCYC